MRGGPAPLCGVPAGYGPVQICSRLISWRLISWSGLKVGLIKSAARLKSLRCLGPPSGKHTNTPVWTGHSDRWREGVRLAHTSTFTQFQHNNMVLLSYQQQDRCPAFLSTPRLKPQIFSVKLKENTPIISKSKHIRFLHSDTAGGPVIVNTAK